MKTLVTGGCSFSECISPWIDTWPRHLARALPDYQHISTAMGSQGNGLISRRIIYQITQLLKTINAKDILVGIMWSSPVRHDFYSIDELELEPHDGWIENPTRFVDNTTGGWVIVNPGWRNQYAVQHYGNFYNHTGSLVYTYEHILRTQWFLKLHDIRYFMSTYTDKIFPPDSINHTEVRYLYDQIDHSKFLPVGGEYEWCRDRSGLPIPGERQGDLHPSTEQHGEFTHRVILPFLKDII